MTVQVLRVVRRVSQTAWASTHKAISSCSVPFCKECRARIAGYAPHADPIRAFRLPQFRPTQINRLFLVTFLTAFFSVLTFHLFFGNSNVEKITRFCHIRARGKVVPLPCHLKARQRQSGRNQCLLARGRTAYASPILRAHCCLLNVGRYQQ